MIKSMVALALVGTVLLFNTVAQAGLVSFSADATSSWSYSGAVVSQDISTTFPLELTMSAQANSKFTITTTTTNESSIIWDRYILTLDPQGDATFAQQDAGSTKFKTVDYVSLYRIEFLAPDEVLPGQVVTLQFDISIPDGAPLTFTLTQNPIPEPATAALLGLGALLILGRRKK
jgi:hypothetical protein